MNTPDQREEQTEEFGELLKFTVAGYLGGLAAGTILDRFGFQRSAYGQWLVRTLSGEGESIMEGFYALAARARGATPNLSEAYGCGKFLGMAVPWVVDAASRFLGVDVYGVEGFYIPFFYAMSDQVGAGVSGFLFFRRRSSSLRQAVRSYFAHPVMVAGVAVVLAVPFGLASARVLGFSPSTQLSTALETIVANLCWVPPLTGWLSERRRRNGRPEHTMKRESPRT